MIYHKGRWLIAPEIKALLDKLEDMNEELRSEADRVLRENTVLREKQESADRQIAEYKRFLKAAVEDFKEINSDILTCKYCKWYSADNDECTFSPDDTPCEKICGWKHEGEALKLIEEEGRDNA